MSTIIKDPLAKLDSPDVLMINNKQQWDLIINSLLTDRGAFHLWSTERERESRKHFQQLHDRENSLF